MASLVFLALWKSYQNKVIARRNIGFIGNLSAESESAINFTSNRNTSVMTSSVFAFNAKIRSRRTSTYGDHRGGLSCFLRCACAGMNPR